jgi:hypothetical protein
MFGETESRKFTPAFGCAERSPQAVKRLGPPGCVRGNPTEENPLRSILVVCSELKLKSQLRRARSADRYSGLNPALSAPEKRLASVSVESPKNGLVSRAGYSVRNCLVSLGGGAVNAALLRIFPPGYCAVTLRHRQRQHLEQLIRRYLFRCGPKSRFGGGIFWVSVANVTKVGMSSRLPTTMVVFREEVFRDRVLNGCCRMSRRRRSMW